MFHLRASLRSLPSELIEEIIIIATLLGDVRAPSALAQTCRAFRALVYYHQVHKHLWREVFLVHFDDPRPAHEVRAHGRVPQQQLRLNPNNKGKGNSKNRYVASHDFPWEEEYKMRIWTESFILRRTRPPISGSSSPRDARSDLPSTDAELYTILETLLRAILTAVPLPSHALASMASHCPPRSLLHPHPFLPPVLIVAHTHPTLGHSSRNISWLARVLEHGLPRALMASLTVFDENGQVDVQKKPVRWDGLLAKLVAQVGLMTPHTYANHTEHITDVDKYVTPESHDLSDDDSDFEPQPESGDLEESDGESESDVDGEYLSQAMVISPTTSQDGVRRLARLRVYNTAYLQPSRAFGPFLPLETHHAPSSAATQNSASGAFEEKEQALVDHNLGSPSIAVLPVPLIPDNDSESSPIDGIDLPQLLDDNDDDANDDSDDETVGDATAIAQPNGDINPVPLRSPMPTTDLSGTGRMYNPGVSGDQALEFDWAWIAAARRVIELNLRDLLRRNRHQGVLRALLSLEGLRSCSAPGFPASAPEPAAVLGEGSDGRMSKDGEGWDWAGVEGQWRRCVCWMNHRDFIPNNAKPLATRFADPALDEVMRIIPYTLRITHYSRAPAWPGRPKLHVAGYVLRDSSAPTESAEDRQRRLCGTVEMTPSGDVRWTISFFCEEGQWSTEGVQIGGRGSAMGVIGLWTSAEHELSDPLGPFWAWKVGPLNDLCPPTLGGRLQQGQGGTASAGAGAGAGASGSQAEAGLGLATPLPNGLVKDDGV